MKTELRWWENKCFSHTLDSDPGKKTNWEHLKCSNFAGNCRFPVFFGRFLPFVVFPPGGRMAPLEKQRTGQTTWRLKAIWVQLPTNRHMRPSRGLKRFQPDKSSHYTAAEEAELCLLLSAPPSERRAAAERNIQVLQQLPINALDCDLLSKLGLKRPDGNTVVGTWFSFLLTVVYHRKDFRFRFYRICLVCRKWVLRSDCSLPQTIRSSKKNSLNLSPLIR